VLGGTGEDVIDAVDTTRTLAGSSLKRIQVEDAFGREAVKILTASDSFWSLEGAYKPFEGSADCR
jgi:hypothetical protein